MYDHDDLHEMFLSDIAATVGTQCHCHCAFFAEQVSFLSFSLSLFPLATICIHADVAVFAVRGLTIQSSNFCQRAAFVERYQLKPKKSLYRAGGSSSAGIEPGGNGQ